MAALDYLLWFQELRYNVPLIETVAILFSSRAFYLVLPFMVAAALFWYKGHRDGFLIAMGLTFASVAAETIKGAVAEPRPWELDSRIDMVEGVHQSGYSFPSGHTAMVFSSLVPAGLISRDRMVLTLLVCVSTVVVVSRLVLCCHTYVDVLGGAATGLAVSLCCWYGIRLSERGEVWFHGVTLAFLVCSVAGMSAMSLVGRMDVDDLLLRTGFVVGITVSRELDHRYGRDLPLGSGICDRFKSYLLGMAVAAVLFVAPAVAIPPVGAAIGAALIMVWCFFAYPELYLRRASSC